MDSTLAQLSEKHRSALRWFQDNAGRVFTSRPRDVGVGIAVTGTQTGIWKPSEIDFALSVIQTPSHQYPDALFEHEQTWVFKYHQQGDARLGINSHYTNRALDRCMSAGVPVGVILPNPAPPHRGYKVLGLGFVDSYANGYFILDGPAHLDNSGFALGTLATGSLALIDFAAEDHSDYSGTDARQQVFASVIRRQGQPHFRHELLVAYDGRCAVSEFDAAESLEAAHIHPYSGPRSNHISNGLLLRADVHDLFDLGLVAVDTAHQTLLLSSALETTQYEQYAGRRLHLPQEHALWPSSDLLDEHRQLAGL